MQAKAPRQRRGWQNRISVVVAIVVAGSLIAAGPAAAQTGDRFQAHRRRGHPPPHLLRRQAQAEGLLRVHRRGRHRRPRRDRRPGDAPAGDQLRRARRAAEHRRTSPRGTASWPTAPRPPTATTSSGSAAQPAARRRRRARPRFAYHSYRFPLDRPPQLRRRLRRRAQTTRARTCSRSAGARSAPPRRPGPDQRRPVGGRQLPRHRRQGDEARHLLRPHGRALAAARRATACAPGR